MLFLLLVIFQEAFHQPFCECLTIGIYHQPTLIERILDIAQLHKKTEAGVVWESTYKLRPLTVPEKPRLG